MANPNWRPGISGNPGGRPVKNRAWTEILEKAGNKTIMYNGRSVARKRLIADLVMQAVSTGEITFPDGMTLHCGDFKEWSDFVMKIYHHIDGPAKAEGPLEVDLPADSNFERALRNAYGNDPSTGSGYDDSSSTDH